MSEQDVIYEYAQAELRASGLGLRLAATRVDFVLRDRTRNLQEIARCSTITQVNEVLGRRAAALRQE